MTKFEQRLESILRDIYELGIALDRDDYSDWLNKLENFYDDGHIRWLIVQAERVKTLESIADGLRDELDTWVDSYYHEWDKNDKLTSEIAKLKGERS